MHVSSGRLLLLRTGKKVFIWLALLLAPMGASLAHAQAAPSAFRDAASIWVGVDYSNYHASFPYASGIRMTGMGGFADWNFTGGHIGVEGRANFLRWGGFYDTTESSYLAGPRYMFLRWHRLQPYGKALIGVGSIHYPFKIGDASYFAFAPGGGVNYRLSYRWTVRGDYEFQWWMNSPGYPNQAKHGLSPNGASIGIAYRLFPR
jgi:opacity protein-like surface antigen